MMKNIFAIFLGILMIPSFALIDVYNDAIVVLKLKLMYLKKFKFQALKVHVFCRSGHVKIKGLLASRGNCKTAENMALSLPTVIEVDAGMLSYV